ncbi:hypothetical protein E2C01_024573 [Portunus trituberculatus]|uniref:Uncharacterized protein n=1 Tax=Portunus trituberculatus TaxID=210409 RepID=A0A5B7ECP8_PORTR|nr:hypothetical protein [Portunus trituberculatus]
MGAQAREGGREHGRRSTQPSAQHTFPHTAFRPLPTPSAALTPLDTLLTTLPEPLAYRWRQEAERRRSYFTPQTPPYSRQGNPQDATLVRDTYIQRLCAVRGGI